MELSPKRPINVSHNAASSLAGRGGKLWPSGPASDFLIGDIAGWLGQAWALVTRENRKGALSEGWGVWQGNRGNF